MTILFLFSVTPTHTPARLSGECPKGDKGSSKCPEEFSKKAILKVFIRKKETTLEFFSRILNPSTAQNPMFPSWPISWWRRKKLDPGLKKWFFCWIYWILEYMSVFCEKRRSKERKKSKWISIGLFLIIWNKQHVPKYVCWANDHFDKE